MAAYAYWRLLITDTKDAVSASNKASVQRIRLQTATFDDEYDSVAPSYLDVGGSTVQSSSDAFSAFYNGGGFASGAGLALPQYLGMNFSGGDGNGNFAEEITAFSIVASFATPGTAPKSFEAQVSDDGSSWTTVHTVTNEPDWTAGEERNYVIPAVAKPSGALTIQAINTPVKPSGALTIQAINQPRQSGALTIQAINTPVKPSGALTIQAINQPRQSGALTIQAINMPQQPTAGRRWQLVVMLDGVDVSSRVYGLTEIDATKGKARIAEFSLRPLSGAIDAQEWVKKPVTIDRVTFDGDVEQTRRRRYTGKVHEATYDPNTRLTHFECTDDLQGSLEAQDFSFIDTEIGGYYAAEIMQEPRNGWEYAQQRLLTQPCHYDKDVYGAGRKWNWQAKATPDLVLAGNRIINGSLQVTQAPERGLINQVAITFDFRFPRKWQRELTVDWLYPYNFGTFLESPTTVPTRDMFLSAVDANWLVKSVMFTKLPDTGAYRNLSSELVGWSIAEADRNSKIFRARATLARRWVQDRVERYQIKVQSDASIARFGVIGKTEQYAVDAPDEDDFETRTTSQGLVTTYSSNDVDILSSADYQAPPTGAVPSGLSDAYLDSSQRSAFENAMLTAMALADTEVLASHHTSEVTVQTPVHDDLDLGVTLHIDTSQQAQGTVGRLVERYDTQAGTAIAEVSVDVYAPNAASQLDSSLAVPTAPDNTPVAATPSVNLRSYFGGQNSVPHDPAWRGYVGNYTYGGASGLLNAVFRDKAPAGAVFYPEEFILTAPEVEADLRDERVAVTSLTHHVAIPQELLTLTA